MFNTYEELMKAVAERRKDQLVLEVDMASTFSQEHEDAKKELAQANALKTLTGGQPFLADNLAAIEARVAETKPESESIWIRFSRLDLMEWALLIKQANMTPVDQYEKVLNKTFVGVFNSPDDGVEPLSTDPRLLSSKGDLGILPGGAMHKIVQTFMTWQNSGGEVSIRPTKSGRD